MFPLRLVKERFQLQDLEPVASSESRLRQISSADADNLRVAESQHSKEKNPQQGIF